jgi:hypothetical protein
MNLNVQRGKTNRPQVPVPPPAPAEPVSATAAAPSAAAPYADITHDRSVAPTPGHFQTPARSESVEATLDAKTRLREARAAARAGAVQPAPHGTMLLGGQQIPRLAPPATAPNPVQQKAISAFFESSFRKPGLGVLGRGFQDYRSPEAAREAMRAPLVRDAGGRTPALSQQLVVFRPGLGNVQASPAQIFRAAQYTPGKLVIAYSNRTDPSQNVPRPVDEIDGVPVPPELRGRIFAIGSAQNNIVSWKQSSDNLVETFADLARHAEVLGFDALSSEATLIGHSQGGIDAAATRERLREAGFERAIGQVVTLGSSFGGSPLAQGLLGKAAAGGASLLDCDDARGAIEGLDPKGLAVHFAGKTDLVDAALMGRLGMDRNIRPAFGGLAAISGGLKGTDGMVPVESARKATELGARFELLDRPYDHAGIQEDPAVIDAAMRLLLR